MNLLNVLSKVAFRGMAGFILNGGAESKVILLSIMAVVISEWIFTRTYLLSYVLANSFLGFSMRDNLRQAVFATLLIIWRRIARTPFASTVTVLVTYPNNVLPMSNALYVRRPYAAHPAQRRLNFVTILDGPYELTKRALEYRLQRYGRVYSQRRGRIQSHLYMSSIEESHKAIDCQLSWSWHLPSHRSPDPEPAVVSVENHSSDDNETVTSDNDLSSVMDVQRQDDGDVPASISNVNDDDDDADDHDDSGDDDDDDDDDDDAGVDDDDADANNVNDDVASDDDNEMDDGDSCDEIVARLHADYNESKEDPILGPRKRPREADDSPDLLSKSLRPQDSGSLQSLQESQVPPVSPSEAPT